MDAAHAGGITVVGSANADLVVRVRRAPEAGETVRGERFTTTLGGKGLNQAVAARRAGARTGFVAAVGDDAHGERIRRLLAGEGIDDRGVRVVDEPTGTAHVLVDAGGENRIVVVPGANARLRPADLAAVDWPASRVLLLQLETPMVTVVAAAEDARAAGTTVVLTPAPLPEPGVPPELLALVDLLVLNESEARRLAGAANPASLLDLVPAAVVTLGGRGAAYADRAGQEMTAAGRPAAAVDTTGAGDTFVGYLAAALAAGLPVQRALLSANSAAALSVTRPGAIDAIPRAGELG